MTGRLVFRQGRGMLQSLALILGLALSQGVHASAPPLMPNFKLPGVNPKDTVEIGKLRGSVVLIDFWASWCGPCKRTLPALHAMKAEFPEPVFLAISVDEDLAKAKRFLATGNPDGLVTLHDPNGKVAELLNISGMPTLILVDKKGHIRFRHDGYTERDLAKIKVELQVLEREK
jgi:cytochrome c biogenesis protein CcmG, thiol:disulfide interchange protein DsbE